MPRLLLQAGHLVAVEELGEAAHLIVHHTAGVVPGASQGTQEELPVFGVASQLRRHHAAAAVREDHNHFTSCLLSLPTG